MQCIINKKIFGYYFAMKPKIELLLQCGVTYQPLTIAFSLLKERYEIVRAHIITTYSAMPAIEKVLETFFPEQLYIIYGELVDAAGSAHDQFEYAANINIALKTTKHDVIGIIASGTSWMTWHFCKATSEIDTYIVKTSKAFEEKSFFPQNEILAIDERGIIGENCGKTPVVYLQKLYNKPQATKIYVDNKKIVFLGHSIELPTQLAAMYAFLIEKGGNLDLSNDYTVEFNLFCEKNQAFDNERAIVDSFQARFKPNVSKINSILGDAPDLAKKHLVIERDNNRFYMSGWELVL